MRLDGLTYESIPETSALVVHSHSSMGFGGVHRNTDVPMNLEPHNRGKESEFITGCLVTVVILAVLIIWTYQLIMQVFT